MKKILFTSLFVFYMLINWSCEKKNTTENIDTNPEPTPEGTSIGIAVSKIIGPDGGTIASADGNVILEIPAGAISTDTEISIQPITNNAPNGTGNAYLFEPEGTVFNTPATLTFHYTTVTDAEYQPPLTGIAFQDADGIWYSTRQFTWDTINKTVSTTTTHFSGWATFDVLVIQATGSVLHEDGLYKLKVNESGEFKVTMINDDPLIPSANGDEELMALKVKDNNAYDKIVKEWDVNGVKYGNSAFGTATPGIQDTSYCIYKAPANEPEGSKNPVQLAAILKDLAYKDPLTGKIFNNLKLNVPIRIIGDFEFELKIKLTQDNVSGGLIAIPFTVIDSSFMKLKIHDDIFTFSNFQNSPGIVLPAFGTDGLCSSNWLSEGFSGPLNITSADGYLFPTPANKSQILFNLKGVGKFPKFHVICSGNAMDLGGEEAPGSFILYFNLVDSIQTYLDASGYIFAKLTPLN